MCTPARSRRIAALFCGVAVFGCSSEPASGVLPTHEFDVTDDGLIVGMLQGSEECLWVGDDEATATSLVFPRGTTVRMVDPDGLEVASEDGWSARVGSVVGIEGGAASSLPNCLGNGSAPFAVGWIYPEE